MPKFAVVLLSIWLFLFSAGGCARQSQAPGVGAFEMTLATTPAPPTVGASTLSISLSDEAGVPVEDARLAIKGDMSHSGMAPVLAEVAGGPGGVYTVPFTWTMAGDWFVTVDATLADERVVSRRFTLSVVGEMDMDP